jgi:hypothetical protein
LELSGKLLEALVIAVSGELVYMVEEILGLVRLDHQPLVFLVMAEYLILLISNQPLEFVDMRMTRIVVAETSGCMVQQVIQA